jgi:hypothetical protein
VSTADQLTTTAEEYCKKPSISEMKFCAVGDCPYNVTDRVLDRGKDKGKTRGRDRDRNTFVLF